MGTAELLLVGCRAAACWIGAFLLICHDKLLAGLRGSDKRLDADRNMCRGCRREKAGLLPLIRMQTLEITAAAKTLRNYARNCTSLVTALREQRAWGPKSSPPTFKSVIQLFPN
jgi:hypothetical protein